MVTFQLEHPLIHLMKSFSGISTSSSFQGRTFMRSGIQDSDEETYAKNVVLDDISTEFTGDRRTLIFIQMVIM